MLLKSSNPGFKRAYVMLVITLLLIGVVSTASAQQSGGILRVGMNAPVDLDPAQGNNDPEILFNRTIYDYLIEILPDGTPAPNLAKSWDISEDGLTYTFTLEEGVTFHDGSPFSSADVVYTFKRLKDVDSPALNLLGEFEVSAADANTVVFTIPQPNADFLYGVGGRLAPIIKDGMESPNLVVEGGNPLINFNGTGPFMLTELKTNERAVFAKNTNYWQPDRPYLDGLEYIYFSDSESEINALLSGEVDFIFKIAIDRLPDLEGVEGINVIEEPTNLHPVIRLRADEGFVGSDVRVRQAFKMATDRETLNDLLLDGRGVIGNNNPIGPLYGLYYSKSESEPAYDPAGACALLQEAGYDRLETTLYVVDAFNYADLATVLQQQWQEACIDVEILVRPENVYYGDNEWMDVELGITGWGSRPIAQQYLVEAYISDGIYNESHWSNAALDELVAEASVTADIEKRAEIYAQITEIFAEEGPIIIPWFSPMLGAAAANVKDLAMNPFPGLTDFRSVTIEN